MVFTELRNQVQLKFLSPISIPKGGKNEKKKEISKPIHLAIKKRKKEKKRKIQHWDPINGGSWSLIPEVHLFPARFN